MLFNDIHQHKSGENYVKTIRRASSNTSEHHLDEEYLLENSLAGKFRVITIYSLSKQAFVPALTRMENATQDPPQRRGQQVLAEITRLENFVDNVSNQATPKVSSPDEMVIQMRGPKITPLTWSPVDCNKLSVLAPPKEKTPERHPVKEMRPGLRRRLTLSPVKNSCCDNKISADSIVYKKIKSLTG